MSEVCALSLTFNRFSFRHIIAELTTAICAGQLYTYFYGITYIIISLHMTCKHYSKSTNPYEESALASLINYMTSNILCGLTIYSAHVSKLSIQS